MEESGSDVVEAREYRVDCFGHFGTARVRKQGGEQILVLAAQLGCMLLGQRTLAVARGVEQLYDLIGHAGESRDDNDDGVPSCRIGNNR